MPLRKIRDSWWVDIHYEKVRYRKKSPLNTRAGAQMYEFKSLRPHHKNPFNEGVFVVVIRIFASCP